MSRTAAEALLRRWLDIKAELAEASAGTFAQYDRVTRLHTQALHVEARILDAMTAGSAPAARDANRFGWDGQSDPLKVE